MLNITATDTELSNMHDKLMAIETDLIAKIKSMCELVDTAIASVSSNDALLALTESLKMLKSNLERLVTVSSYWEYEHITSCTDINMKITNLELNIRMYMSLIVEVSRNNTWLAYDTNMMTSNYLLRRFQLTSDQITTFDSIISSSVQLQMAYIAYIRELSVTSSLETYVMVNMKVYRSKYCVCSNSSTTTGTSNLETNFNYIEKPLTTRQAKIVNISKVARTQLTRAISLISILQLSSVLNSHTTYIDRVSELNDYKYVNVTEATSCSDLMTRTALAIYKNKQYSGINSKIINHLVTLQGYIAVLNGTILMNNSSLTITQRTAVQDVANSYTFMVKEYMEYIKELSLSSVKMMTIQIDIEHISDTYCSCSDKQSGEVADTTKGGCFYFFF
jgi:hypothetical protein